MQRDEILNAVITIIADCVAVAVPQVSEQARLINELGMDSLDFLDVIFAVEKRFSIKLRDTEFEKLLRLDILQEKSDAQEPLTDAELAPYLHYLPALVRESPRPEVTAISLYSYLTAESLVLAVEEVLH